MNKRGLFGFMMVMMLSIFVVACSEKSDDEESKDNDKKVETADTNEKEENAVPEDEELFTVLDKNLQTIQDQDIDGYMETIHPESPAYDSTKDIMDQMTVYTLDIELSKLSVEEKSADEAKVSYTQRSMKVDGPEYQNNEVSGFHILKPDNGKWKIFTSEATEQVALDENGEVLNTEEADMSTEVEMEGEYASIITDLEMPFESDKWGLANYKEADGEAVAEFIAMDGTDDSELSELLAVHYFEDGADLIGTEVFIDTMEKNLSEMITGKLEFNRGKITEEEGTFDFTVKEDDVELDQEEIGRAFVKDGDLFVVRYTTLVEKMDDKDTWIEKLKEVK